MSFKFSALIGIFVVVLATPIIAFSDTSEFQVNTYTNDSQGYASTEMDSSGNFVITWESYGQDGSIGSTYGIFAKRYDSDGIPHGSEFQVNTYSEYDQKNPSLAMDDSGNFVIAWESNVQDGSICGIYAQRYQNDGSKNGSEFQVNTYTSSTQVTPSVAIDNDGNFIITWASFGQDGDGFGIYAQIYMSDGSKDGEEF